MIPVKQTKVVVINKDGKTVQNGNCYAAAIASMLEVPITEVPNVEVFFQFDTFFWNDVMDKFLELKGFELISDNRFKCFHPEIADKSFQNEEWLATNAVDLQGQFYFVVGESLRKVRHICIYQNGVMVHDPHPSNDGLVTLEEFKTLDKIKK